MLQWRMSYRRDHFRLTAYPENTIRVDLPACWVVDNVVSTSIEVYLLFYIRNTENKTSSRLFFNCFLLYSPIDSARWSYGNASSMEWKIPTYDKTIKLLLSTWAQNRHLVTLGISWGSGDQERGLRSKRWIEMIERLSRLFVMPIGWGCYLPICRSLSFWCNTGGRCIRLVGLHVLARFKT